MRHKVKGRKLNRTKSHRQATLRALATALLKHKKIKTTVAKAKETRVFVEPMITKAKVDSVANRRLIARDIKDNEVVQELFNQIVPKIGDRPGGYTRVVKLGQRLGDAAEMAIIELVDYSEAVEKKPRKKKEKKEETPAPVEAAETKEEEVKSEDVQEAEVIEESEEKPEEPKEEASADEEKKEEVKAEESETEEKEEEKPSEDKKEEK